MMRRADEGGWRVAGTGASRPLRRRAVAPRSDSRWRSFGCVALCLLAGAANAERQRGATLEIWTANAPLPTVLEQIIDQENLDVRVGDDVNGLVSGRLEGTVGEVLEPLLDTYGLTVHHDGSTVWFDRRGRDVVERVALEPEREPMLAEWATRELDGAAPNGKGRVERDGEALLVSGTRAFVQETLGRIEAARGALGGEEGAVPAMPVRQPAEVLALPEAVDDGDDDVATTGTANAAADAVRDAAAGPRYRSISDVPGYHTDYR